MNKEIQKKIVEVCIKIARRSEGALIIFGDLNKGFYNPLVKQTIKPFDIKDNIKLFESLALMDGAVLVGLNGRLYAYGVKIQSNQIFKGFGTRHSGGLSASLRKGITSFVVSEEDSKIRVFRFGKIVMQIDTLQKGVEKRVSEISNLLESIGIGAIGVATAPFIGLVGVSLIPGVIIFGGAYHLIKEMMRR